MRKILISLITVTSLFTGSAFADGYHHHGGGYYQSNGYGWAAPLVLGGVFGYAIAQQPRTVIVQQQPPIIYQQQPPVVYQQSVPYGYHYETILDANCNCYRTVMIPN